MEHKLKTEAEAVSKKMIYIFGPVPFDMRVCYEHGRKRKEYGNLQSGIPCIIFMTLWSLTAESEGDEYSRCLTSCCCWWGWWWGGISNSQEVTISALLKARTDRVSLTKWQNNKINWRLDHQEYEVMKLPQVTISKNKVQRIKLYRNWKRK